MDVGSYTVLGASAVAKVIKVSKVSGTFFRGSHDVSEYLSGDHVAIFLHKKRDLNPVELVQESAQKCERLARAPIEEFALENRGAAFYGSRYLRDGSASDAADASNHIGMMRGCNHGYGDHRHWKSL